MVTLWPPNNTAPITLESQWGVARNRGRGGGGGKSSWQACNIDPWWLAWVTMQALLACEVPHMADPWPAGLEVTLPKLHLATLYKPDSQVDPTFITTVFGVEASHMSTAWSITLPRHLLLPLTAQVKRGILTGGDPLPPPSRLPSALINLRRGGKYEDQPFQSQDWSISNFTPMLDSNIKLQYVRSSITMERRVPVAWTCIPYFSGSRSGVLHLYSLVLLCIQ